MSKFVEFVVLRNLPLSRPNADDAGQQKSTQFGGIARSSISSQCQKRSFRNLWREMYANNPNQLAKLVGHRTVFVPNLVSKIAQEFNVDEAKRKEAIDLVVKTFFDKKPVTKTNKKTNLSKEVTNYLVFTSENEIRTYLKYILEGGKDLKKAFPSPKNISADVALSGRMQTNALSYEVYASLQVAYAFGVNELPDEHDYFTAVDDTKNDSDSEDGFGEGAGHIDALSCNSSCYFQYANLCFDKFVSNLGGNKELAVEAVGDLIRAFVQSVPSGKANTFANQNVMPYFVLVRVSDQPLQPADAFVKPVRPTHSLSLNAAAAQRLLKWYNKSTKTWGTDLSNSYALLNDLDFDNIKDLAGELPNLPKEVNYNDLISSIKSAL